MLLSLIRELLLSIKHRSMELIIERTYVDIASASHERCWSWDNLCEMMVEVSEGGSKSRWYGRNGAETMLRAFQGAVEDESRGDGQKRRVSEWKVRVSYVNQKGETLLVISVPGTAEPGSEHGEIASLRVRACRSLHMPARNTSRSLLEERSPASSARSDLVSYLV
ncbi:hypothetical protein PMIN02_009234 [Paraphaeosphaeria minitans]